MRWQRLLIGHACEVETDKQGRILILYVLGERAKLNKNYQS
jgi:DNA-binding transcriptional regulator/RsmH inhibitor MraZ